MYTYKILSLLISYYYTFRPTWYFSGNTKIMQNAWEVNLTLYAPYIILQYVYKPTRCTKFL